MIWRFSSFIVITENNIFFNSQPRDNKKKIKKIPKLINHIAVLMIRCIINHAP